MEAAAMAKDDTDTLRKRREKLEAELAVLRDQERTAAEKCHAIAGRAALDYAAKNPGFKEELMRALDAEVVKERERKLFGLAGTGKGKLASRTSEATASGPAAVAATTEGRESTP
jgi:hypothetical protein